MIMDFNHDYGTYLSSYVIFHIHSSYLMFTSFEIKSLKPKTSFYVFRYKLNLLYNTVYVNMQRFPHR